MVCSLGSAKMAAVARLLAPGSVSQTPTEEVVHQKLAMQYVRQELRQADEANLLDEEDMHIFCLRPMTDPLDLVCCNACKKPLKASQYSAHAELCKSVNSGADKIPELNGPVVNKKSSRKDRKKIPIPHTNQKPPVREIEKFESADSDHITAAKSHVNEQIQMPAYTDVKRNTRLNVTQKVISSRVSPCLENVTRCSSKPSKRAATDNPSNPGTKSLCTTTSQVPPYVPAPIATKIYYSQRNHRLRRAIFHMFYGESSKESRTEASHLQESPTNAIPTQNPSPGTFSNELVVNQQEDDHFVPQGQTPDQMLVASSQQCTSSVGGFASSTNMVYQQYSVNNTVGPRYVKNSYSFAGKAGNSLGTFAQGNGNIPVVQDS